MMFNTSTKTQLIHFDPFLNVKNLTKIPKNPTKIVDSHIHYLHFTLGDPVSGSPPRPSSSTNSLRPPLSITVHFIKYDDVHIFVIQ